MGVSKMHPAEAVAEAAVAGVTLFGENRVQAFEAKHDRLRQLGVSDAEVHLIGHLQSNKSVRAAEIFSGIDSVDSLRLAERLNEAANKVRTKLPVLLEIKLSAEPVSYTHLDVYKRQEYPRIHRPGHEAETCVTAPQRAIAVENRNPRRAREYGAAEFLMGEANNRTGLQRRQRGPHLYPTNFRNGRVNQRGPFSGIRCQHCNQLKSRAFENQGVACRAGFARPGIFPQK